MNEIRINVDTETNPHPPKVVIQENGTILISMPADEFVAWLKRARRLIYENNEGDGPSPDGNTPSNSLPGAGA